VLVLAPLFTIIFLAIVRQNGRHDLQPDALIAPILIALWWVALQHGGQIGRPLPGRSSSCQSASTRAITESSMRSGAPHARCVSVPIFTVASMPSLPITARRPATSGGVLRYSTICGAIPAARRISSAARDLERGPRPAKNA
jgi:hypothetical protein